MQISRFCIFCVVIQFVSLSQSFWFLCLEYMSLLQPYMVHSSHPSSIYRVVSTLKLYFFTFPPILTSVSGLSSHLPSTLNPFSSPSPTSFSCLMLCALGGCFKYLPRVPQGLLMIRGAAGVGKTSCSTGVLHLQLVRKVVPHNGCYEPSHQ